MQIETLKIFCDLISTGRFSGAATLNQISQSAVSQQISSLEKRFGVPLLERLRSGVALTPEGELFYQAARDILNIFEDIHVRISSLPQSATGALRIAAVHTIGLHNLPPVLRQFRSRFPRIEVSTEYHRSTDIYRHVLSGKADLGLVAFPTRRTGVEIEAFGNDELILISSPNNPLANEPEITPCLIGIHKFIAFTADLPTRKVIDRHLANAGVTFTPHLEFDTVETLKRAVLVENAISILPETAVRDELQRGELVRLNLTGPPITRTLGWVTRRNVAKSLPVQLFTQHLREYRATQEAPVSFPMI